MRRGYKSIVVACGLILGGATPPSQSGITKADQSLSHQVAKSLADISSSLRQANEPSNLNQPCHPKEEKRHSQLCAQWKAADAALSAAKATWIFGIISAFIGTLTLSAAGFAAFYAKKAADHSKDSVSESKRSANAAELTLATTIRAFDQQIRPYIAISNTDDTTLEPFSRDTIIIFKIKNFGQIPATSVRLSMGEATLTEPIGNFIIPLSDKGGDYGLIAPGDERQEKIHSQNVALSHIAELAQRKQKFLVRLRIDYYWSSYSDYHDITLILDDPSKNQWLLMDDRRRHNGGV